MNAAAARKTPVRKSTRKVANPFQDHVEDGSVWEVSYDDWVRHTHEPPAIFQLELMWPRLRAALAGAANPSDEVVDVGVLGYGKRGKHRVLYRMSGNGRKIAWDNTPPKTLRLRIHNFRKLSELAAAFALPRSVQSQLEAQYGSTLAQGVGREPLDVAAAMGVEVKSARLRNGLSISYEYVFRGYSNLSRPGVPFDTCSALVVLGPEPLAELEAMSVATEEAIAPVLGAALAGLYLAPDAGRHFFAMLFKPLIEFEAEVPAYDTLVRLTDVARRRIYDFRTLGPATVRSSDAMSSLFYQVFNAFADYAIASLNDDAGTAGSVSRDVRSILASGAAQSGALETDPSRYLKLRRQLVKKAGHRPELFDKHVSRRGEVELSVRLAAAAQEIDQGVANNVPAVRRYHRQLRAGKMPKPLPETYFGQEVDKEKGKEERGLGWARRVLRHAELREKMQAEDGVLATRYRQLEQEGAPTVIAADDPILNWEAHQRARMRGLFAHDPALRPEWMATLETIGLQVVHPLDSFRDKLIAAVQVLADQGFGPVPKGWKTPVEMDVATATTFIIRSRQYRKQGKFGFQRIRLMDELNLHHSPKRLASETAKDSGKPKGRPGRPPLHDKFLRELIAYQREHGEGSRPRRSDGEYKKLANWIDRKVAAYRASTLPNGYPRNFFVRLAGLGVLPSADEVQAEMERRYEEFRKKHPRAPVPGTPGTQGRSRLGAFLTGLMEVGDEAPFDAYPRQWVEHFRKLGAIK